MRRVIAIAALIGALVAFPLRANASSPTKTWGYYGTTLTAAIIGPGGNYVDYFKRYAEQNGPTAKILDIRIIGPSPSGGAQCWDLENGNGAGCGWHLVTLQPNILYPLNVGEYRDMPVGQYCMQFDYYGATYITEYCADVEPYT